MKFTVSQIYFAAITLPMISGLATIPAKSAFSTTIKEQAENVPVVDSKWSTASTFRSEEEIDIPAVIASPMEVEDKPFRVMADSETRGRSQNLRIKVVNPLQPFHLGLTWNGSKPNPVYYKWVPVLGTQEQYLPPSTFEEGDAVRAPSQTGVYELQIVTPRRASMVEGIRVIVTTPISAKRNGYIEGYYIGNYSMENSERADNYAIPAGFVRVTPQNQDMQISEHFTLREFLTKDQHNVWPKYVVISENLIDKLELILEEAQQVGIPAHRMVIMSGYRTPQYNNQGLNNGRAQLSRHTYGDAADVWIDSDNDWHMDDLNRDGRIDTGDSRVMLQLVDRIETRYPSLIGGAGIYPATRAHGPFIHIDVRGRAARW